MRHRYLLANHGGAFLLGSCAAVQKGDAVVKYEKSNGEAMMTKATANGTYSLYSSTDVQPKVSHYLSKGEDIGFRKSDGRLMAVAGTANPIPLENGDYYWRLR